MRNLKLRITPEMARKATEERLASAGLVSCTCLVANAMRKLDGKNWNITYTHGYSEEPHEKFVFDGELYAIVRRFTSRMDLPEALAWFERTYPNGFETELVIRKIGEA